MQSNSLLKKVKKHFFIYLMLLPIIIYFVIFSYYPLILGFINSFQDVKIIGDAQFVGLNNYMEVLKNPLYIGAFKNTVIVGVFTFVLQFIMGLLVALSLNEIKNKIVKSLVQSVTYIPYLLSWSVVGGIWITLFAPNGLINGVLQSISPENFTPIIFMSEPTFARAIMIFTGAWKGAGYFAVLFLAAIVSIDGSIYEAACIDGASRFKQLFYITIPNIKPTMKVVTVLGTMSLLRNFDQIFVMGNSSIMDQVRNLLYLIYNDGILRFKIGNATAAATLVLIATLIISTIVRKLIKYDESYD